MNLNTLNKFLISLILAFLFIPYVVFAADVGAAIAPFVYLTNILELSFLVLLSTFFIFAIRKIFKLYSYKDSEKKLKIKYVLINFLIAIIISELLIRLSTKFHVFLYYTYLEPRDLKALQFFSLIYSLYQPVFLMIIAPVTFVFFLIINLIISFTGSFRKIGFFNTSLFYSLAGFLMVLIILPAIIMPVASMRAKNTVDNESLMISQGRCDAIIDLYNQRIKSIKHEQQKKAVEREYHNTLGKCYLIKARKEDNFNFCESIPKDVYVSSVCYNYFANKNKDLAFCNKDQSGNLDTECIRIVAKAKGDANICLYNNRIVEYKTDSVYNCILGVAVKNKDSDVCKLTGFPYQNDCMDTVNSDYSEYPESFELEYYGGDIK